MKIVFATMNEHKVAELRQMLAGLCAEIGLEIVSMAEFGDLADVVETEVTFTGNAMLKARTIAAATGLPALADDSGLSVKAMGGSPGVFSSRWSGSRAGAALSRAERDRANIALLLDQLDEVADKYRDASFVCAAVFALPNGLVRTAEGQMHGRLAREPRGTNGFGYDPIFIPVDQPAGEERTLGEFTDAQKNAISHRGRAMRRMAPHIRELLTQ
ncbi:MAG TPA: RdgB/HAM1 family non-canonical purine NTP pyrophosphatase [Intrasporangiaceae bacterium]|nr:RdgB/HAM1 family non-canonical purine NTP pyrophosphatase [Intrasporangiaceae bacterium]